MNHTSNAEDGVLYRFLNGAHPWEASWHRPEETAPTGRPHGSAGICFTPGDKLLLVSSDGTTWTPPGGRPEDGESWRQTLDREVREEACAEVKAAVLLGFARGRGLAGPEEGLILVRSLWVARVEVLPWMPEFDTSRRQLHPGIESRGTFRHPGQAPQIHSRWIEEAIAHIGLI